MTDDLHRLLAASIGAEPPVGSPHAAVRRRARRIRHRRHAVGAAGAAGVAAVAVAVPTMTGDRRTSLAPTAAPLAAAPTTRAQYHGELYPPTDRRCDVDYGPARPFTEEGPVQVVGKSPGIEARQEGRDYAQIRPGE